MELLGIELSQNEFDYLLCEQNKGKELKIVDGKIIAEEHIPSTPEININKIHNLKDWFQNEYSYKEQKFRRLIALNKLDDDGIDAKQKLTELYIQAESKRLEIQMLEKEV